MVTSTQIQNLIQAMSEACVIVTSRSAERVTEICNSDLTQLRKDIPDNILIGTARAARMARRNVAQTSAVSNANEVKSNRSISVSFKTTVKATL